MTSEQQDPISSSPSPDATQPHPSPRPVQSNSAQSMGARLWRSQRENLQILVVALGLALFIRFFIAEPRFIPSDSMFPTLEVGDRLVVEKVAYHFRSPRPGEIVVFDPPQQLLKQGYTVDQAFIKRIVARSGQLIQIQNGRVYVDEQPLEEPYIAEPPEYSFPPVIVPEGTFFVMGDNRNNSNDSHVWGFLPEENIIGRAIFRFWPIDRLGAIAQINPDTTPQTVSHISLSQATRSAGNAAVQPSTLQAD